jgi:REP element-mobilizing transposase RayT
MNRGNRRQTVFGSDDDVALFLDRLGEFSLSYHVKVLCYCLMSNHFHLYVKTVDANLSKFMQSLLTSFTILKNRRDRSSGHLFQGRYKAVLVEDQAYGSELSRYIHLNPARTTSAKAMDIERRRDLLRAQKLSSYSSIIGLAKSPEWLEPSLILDKWDGTLKEQRLKYSRYVEEGLMRDICDPMESAVARTVLGSDTFVDKIRRALKDISENLNLRRELGEKAKSCMQVLPGQVFHQ